MQGMHRCRTAPEQTRCKIEELFVIKAYNSYGLSEMNGPGVAFECVYQTGLRL
jgi:phenylacetate-CoA ligase